jgi:hypothetical protein
MSQARRERRKEKLGASSSGQNWGRIAIFAVIIAAAFAVVFYLKHRTDHQHDAFARCLKDRGVKMYGAYWCPHCQEQKEKFGASTLEDYGPYVECGVKGDLHGLSQVCKDEGIKHYPTWQFPPTGERVERIFSLEELSDRTGCPLP